MCSITKDSENIPIYQEIFGVLTGEWMGYSCDVKKGVNWKESASDYKRTGIQTKKAGKTPGLYNNSFKTHPNLRFTSARNSFTSSPCRFQLCLPA